MREPNPLRPEPDDDVARRSIELDVRQETQRARSCTTTRHHVAASDPCTKLAGGNPTSAMVPTLCGSR